MAWKSCLTCYLVSLNIFLYSSNPMSGNLCFEDGIKDIGPKEYTGFLSETNKQVERLFHVIAPHCQDTLPCFYTA